MLDEILSQLGLNATERDVFLYLSNHGARSAAMVAKGSSLNRSTVYSALESLVERGFVQKTKEKGLASFAVVSPELLGRVIENSAKQRYSETMLSAARLPAELRRLSRLHQRETGEFEVTVFESMSAVFAHLEDSLLGGDFSAIFNPQTACVGEGRKVVSEFLKKTAVTRPRIREIVVRGALAEWYKSQIKNPAHRVKELPAESLIVCDLIFSKNRLIITNYASSNLFALRIENRALFQTMNTIFEMLWNSASDRGATSSG